MASSTKIGQVEAADEVVGRVAFIVVGVGRCVVDYVAARTACAGSRAVWAAASAGGNGHSTRIERDRKKWGRKRRDGWPLSARAQLKVALSAFVHLPPAHRDIGVAARSVPLRARGSAAVRAARRFRQALPATASHWRSRYSLSTDRATSRRSDCSSG